VVATQLTIDYSDPRVEQLALNGIFLFGNQGTQSETLAAVVQFARDVYGLNAPQQAYGGPGQLRLVARVRRGRGTSNAWAASIRLSRSPIRRTGWTRACPRHRATGS
jgi:hypothetical protein